MSKEEPKREDYINCDDCRKKTCDRCDLLHYSVDYRNRLTKSEFSEKGDKDELKSLLIAYLSSLPDGTKIEIKIKTEQWVRYAKEIYYMNGEEFIRKEFIPL